MVGDGGAVVIGRDCTQAKGPHSADRGVSSFFNRRNTLVNEDNPMFAFVGGWSVQTCSIEEFLVGMSSLGTPQEIQMVGSFADKDDTKVRTAHRDVDLPLHRDGVYTKALADMQEGMYVEKPNVDIIGMYCVRANDVPCYTTVSKDGMTVLAEVNLGAGQALVMDNTWWHGRRGPVGKRLLIRFWTTLKK
jgi:hypothetical protein